MFVSWRLVYFQIWENKPNLEKFSLVLWSWHWLIVYIHPAVYDTEFKGGPLRPPTPGLEASFQIQS